MSWSKGFLFSSLLSTHFRWTVQHFIVCLIALVHLRVLKYIPLQVPFPYLPWVVMNAAFWEREYPQYYHLRQLTLETFRGRSPWIPRRAPSFQAEKKLFFVSLTLSSVKILLFTLRSWQAFFVPIKILNSVEIWSSRKSGKAQGSLLCASLFFPPRRV